jgi:predicted PurR-regulated permease PerM
MVTKDLGDRLPVEADLRPGTKSPFLAARRSLDPPRIALTVVACLATVFAVSWARDLLVPLLIGIVASYTLSPLVDSLERIRIPRAFATSIVVFGVIGALGLGGYALRGQMQAVIEQLPEAAMRFSDGLARLQVSQAGTMQSVQDAATQMERVTTSAATDPIAEQQPGTHVIVDQPAFRLGQFLWGSSIGALAVMGQAAMVVFLVFFLLLGGDTFKRKFVRMAGPSLTQRRITVHLLDAINASIQKYMLMLLTTNLLVGVLTWIAFRVIGLDNAGAWAAVSAVLHIVPYLGPGVTAIATGMAAYMQFDSFGMMLLVASTTAVIATLVGTFVTTWMTGRIASMNSAAVFISLLFWGWLWGFWGLLLGIPIIVIIKVVSAHVEQLQPLAELLGD